MKCKIRFNLGRGPRYKKWKISYFDKTVDYYEPNEIVLLMHNAKLISNKQQALTINLGGNKSVCAWVECEKVEILKEGFDLNRYPEPINYNPRVLPHWEREEMDIDNKQFNALITMGTKIYEVY